MTTSTTSLTDFLLARIKEDEALAREHVASHGCGIDDAFSVSVTDCWEMSIGMKRWLAECEAKRRIVQRELDSRTKITYRRRLVLQDLASVYADHPDYDESWRP